MFTLSPSQVDGFYQAQFKPRIDRKVETNISNKNNIMENSNLCFIGFPTNSHTLQIAAVDLGPFPMGWW